MQQIFHSLLKRKVIYLVYLLADGLSEIVLDIPLSFETFHSVELVNGRILLHNFNEDLQFTTDFEDLDMDDKLEVYQRLFCCL